jgi:hypothetical protein
MTKSGAKRCNSWWTRSLAFPLSENLMSRDSSRGTQSKVRIESFLLFLEFGLIIGKSNIYIEVEFVRKERGKFDISWCSMASGIT